MPNDPTKGMDVFHWGFTVPVMDEALENWKAQGAEVLVPAAEAPGLNVICCVVQYNDAVFELVAPANDQGREQLAQSLSRGGGLDHVCFFSDDLKTDLSAQEKAGGQVVLPPVYNGVMDRNLAFVATPSGLVVELMERKAQGKLSEDPLEAHFLQTA